MQIYSLTFSFSIFSFPFSYHSRSRQDYGVIHLSQLTPSQLKESSQNVSIVRSHFVLALMSGKIPPHKEQSGLRMQFPTELCFRLRGSRKTETAFYLINKTVNWTSLSSGSLETLLPEEVGTLSKPGGI